MKKIRQAKMVLDWYLGFIQEDLEKLSVLDLAKKQLEVKHYLLSPILLGGSGDEDSLKTGEHKETIPDLSVDLLKTIQDELKVLIEDTKSPAQQTLLGNELCSVHLKGWSASLMECDGIFYGCLSLRKNGKDSDLVDHAKIKYIQAIAGHKRLELLKCKECGKVYSQISKKEKYFCSHRCAAKFISRKRRLANPEEYKKKQADIMRRERAKKKSVIQKDASR